MSTTNSTTNYHLSQYVGSDVTSYLTNYNSDMSAIDTQMKANADAASAANTNASAAITTANAAASDASSALSTANAASSTATSAQTAAQEAQTAAGAAQTDAAAALTASEANNIANLAPAYDPTLTYALGDLVTYVDPETNRGALYKNIVPIGTPEAFNINKWDDVTTSEVFRQKNKLITTITTDTSTTWGDIIEAIAPYIISAHQYHLDRLVGSNLDRYIINVNNNARFSFNHESYAFDADYDSTENVVLMYNKTTSTARAININMQSGIALTSFGTIYKGISTNNTFETTNTFKLYEIVD